MEHILFFFIHIVQTLLILIGLAVMAMVKVFFTNCKDEFLSEVLLSVLFVSSVYQVVKVFSHSSTAAVRCAFFVCAALAHIF